MRAVRTHMPYFVGVALFATAVIAQFPRGVRAVLAISGVVLLVTYGVLSLRRPAEENSGKAPNRSLLAALARYPRALRVTCVMIGVLGAGYLWAATFGDGLHGLKDSAALDRSDSFPDANAAYIAALLAFTAGPFGAALAGFVRPHRLIHWFAAIAAAGGAAFGISRLFV